MKMLLWTLALAAPVALLAQDRAPQPPQPSSGKGIVAVEGCVNGSRFVTPMMDADTVVNWTAGTREYRLEGDEELLDLIRNGHDRHRELITGRLNELPAIVGGQRRTSSGQIGDRTRITIGVREVPAEETGPVGNAAAHAVVSLTVLSVKHLDDKCPIW